MNFRELFLKIRNPKNLFGYLQKTHVFDLIPDKNFLQMKYKVMLNKNLNVDFPVSFNEKLQWLKLYDRNPEYIKLVDKYAVKEYIREKIGDEYIIPTIGVWDKTEDIDWDLLPKSFVMKVTHDSGGLVICSNKELLNKKDAIKKIKRSLKNNYYLFHREWPYKEVPRRIIAEKYMIDGDSNELTDYKFMCFNGKCQCIFTVTERYSSEGMRVTFYDRDWNILPFERGYPAKTEADDKPFNLSKMIELAELLAKDIPFVRIDFYEIRKKIYFGEITFYPGSGFEEFTPEEWDYIMGEWIKLPYIGKE